MKYNFLKLMALVLVLEAAPIFGEGYREYKFVSIQRVSINQSSFLIEGLDAKSVSHSLLGNLDRTASHCLRLVEGLNLARRTSQNYTPHLIVQTYSRPIPKALAKKGIPGPF